MQLFKDKISPLVNCVNGCLVYKIFVKLFLINRHEMIIIIAMIIMRAVRISNSSPQFQFQFAAIAPSGAKLFIRGSLSLSTMAVFVQSHDLIQRNEFIGMVGPNGSGKTTLLKF